MPAKIREEKFVQRFHLTAAEAFGGASLRRSKARALLYEMARAEFNIGSEKNPNDVLTDLRLILRRIQKRRTGWHGSIDLAPIDRE